MTGDRGSDIALTDAVGFKCHLIAKQKLHESRAEAALFPEVLFGVR